MVGMKIKRLEIDSFYTMFTLRQVQKALGCSRATLYRTLKKAGIERYYIPNHPGPKYIWGCSLYKLAKTPIVKKAMKKLRVQVELPCCDIEKISSIVGLTFEFVQQSTIFGWIPMVDDEIPWWYKKAVNGKLKLPLPFK